MGPAKAAVASATTPFHWQDPSLSTESCSGGEKPPACFSVLGVAGSSPGRTSYPQTLPTAFLTVQSLQGWPRRLIAFGQPKKKPFAKAEQVLFSLMKEPSKSQTKWYFRDFFLICIRMVRFEKKAYNTDL